MVESIDTKIQDLSLESTGEAKHSGEGLPTCLLVLGMAGSGKTTFVQVSYLQLKHTCRDLSRHLT